MLIDASRVPRPLRLRATVLTMLSLALVAAGSTPQPPAWAASPPSGASTTGSLGEPLNPSTAEQKDLAEHLRRIGAIFYGAWWCPACFRQKNLFGKEGGSRLPYVECDKDDAGRERCTAARIRAYPTWEVKGERREGTLSIEELKTWSGFGVSNGTSRQP
jgi:hypothetical protein